MDREPTDLPSAGRNDSAERPLRLFVVVPAPPEVRAAAGEVIRRLRGAGDVRWIAPELLHLTLKFLGPTPAEQVPALQQALEKSANIYSRFMVELGGPGAFPNPARARVVWLGLNGPTDRLAALAEEVDRAAQGLGFAREERPFRAHLTLGRVKSPRGLGELARRLSAVGPAEPVAWPVEEIHLVKSDLRPSGPTYTVLGHYPLRREE